MCGSCRSSDPTRRLVQTKEEARKTMLFGRTRTSLPYDMFDAAHTDAEARRARRMESIYHVGQHRIWDGREVLTELIKKHGEPRLGPRERKALARIFSIIM